MKRVFLIFLTLVLVLSAGCANEVSVQETKTTFEQFESGLKEAGLNYEKVTMAADMIGAVEGYKYKLGTGEKIELYRFEPDSETLKNATENKSVHLEGFGSVPAEFNKEMSLLIEDVSNKETIIEIFCSIK